MSHLTCEDVALQLTAAHQEHRVAVHHGAGVIHEDRAIAVAVERDAQGAAARDDGLREPLQIGRAHV